MNLLLWGQLWRRGTEHFEQVLKAEKLYHPYMEICLHLGNSILKRRHCTSSILTKFRENPNLYPHWKSHIYSKAINVLYNEEPRWSAEISTHLHPGHQRQGESCPCPASAAELQWLLNQGCPAWHQALETNPGRGPAATVPQQRVSYNINTEADKPKISLFKLNSTIPFPEAILTYKLSSYVLIHQDQKAVISN